MQGVSGPKAHRDQALAIGPIAHYISYSFKAHKQRPTKKMSRTSFPGFSVQFSPTMPESRWKDTDGIRRVGDGDQDHAATATTTETVTEFTAPASATAHTGLWVIVLRGSTSAPAPPPIR